MFGTKISLVSIPASIVVYYILRETKGFYPSQGRFATTSISLKALAASISLISDINAWAETTIWIFGALVSSRLFEGACSGCNRLSLFALFSLEGWNLDVELTIGASRTPP